MRRSFAWMMDQMMCAMMNRIQWALRHDACTREEFDAYLEACRPFSAETFYYPGQEARTPEFPSDTSSSWPLTIEWPSPHPSGFKENDIARALYFPSDNDTARPTLVVLHALMSASDIGYRRLAKWLNQRGWNVVFPHLPFHYSRVPRGFRQGSLAISSHLPRNAETLKQGVMEIRQIMAALRKKGCREFALLGTSYGGWTAALTAPLEPDFRFVALVQPIVDIEHVIWESPIAAGLRKTVLQNGIFPGQSTDHAHLSSPLHTASPSATHRLIVAGEFDSISPVGPLLKMKEHWGNTDFISVRQGHFGYRALASAQKWMTPLL